MNVSRNRLTILPPLNDSHDLNKLQELYLSGNCLTSDAVRLISGYARLKILHLANNEITNIVDRYEEVLLLLSYVEIGEGTFI